MRRVFPSALLRLMAAAALVAAGGAGAALGGQAKGKGDKKPAAKKKAGGQRGHKGGGKKSGGKKDGGTKGSAKKPRGKDNTHTVTMPKPPGPQRPRADDPTVSSWNETNLEDKGRVVGSLDHCPGCRIEVLGPQMEGIKLLSVKRGDPDYLVEWIAPGTYTLRVTGGGFSLIVPNVPVEAMSDTRLDVEFPVGAGTTGGRAKSKPVKIERWPTWRPPPEPTVPVQNFKPKSFKELNRMWKGVDAPINRRTSSTNKGKHKARGNKGKHKGRRRGGKKGGKKVKLLR